MMSPADWTRIIPLLVILLLIPGLGLAQEHFTDCIDSNVNDATVVVPSDTTVTYPDGDPLRTGDEVALFSDDGQCAGVAIWDSSKTALSLSVADLDSTAGILEGYTANESLKYRVWRASEDREYDVSSTTYSCTLPICRSDGVYERDAVYEVSKLRLPSVPLVPLEEWTAEERPEGIVLEWRTKQDTNTVGYRVEHKSDTTEAWSKLAFVNGAGSKSGPNTYRYEVKTIDYGSHRFRLMQVRQDGSKRPSSSLTVTHTLRSDYEISKVYPNPIQQSGALKLTVKQPQEVVIRLYDILGRSQAVLLDRRIEGNNTEIVQLNFGRIASGQYFLRVNGEGFQQTRRVTVVR